MRYSFKILSVVELGELLADDDVVVRVGASRELGRRGKAAAALLWPLVGVARDDLAAEARAAATFALVALAKSRVAGVVPTVRESTLVGRYPLRARAAWVLEHVECAAANARG